MDDALAAARRFGLDRILSADLLSALRPRESAPGEYLVRSSDKVRDLLFLIEGRTKAYSILDNGQSVLAAFFRPLDVIGEIELFCSDRYSLNVQAMTRARCLALPLPAIRGAAERNARLFMYLCARMGEKLADRAQAEAINARYPVETRFASYLLASRARGGEVLGSDDLGEIADFIGASYRQLARSVRKFRDLGLLDPERGRIRVLDRAALQGLAADLYLPSSRKVDPRDFIKR